MCRYIVREKRAHTEGSVKQIRSFRDRLNTRGRGRDMSVGRLRSGDDIED